MDCKYECLLETISGPIADPNDNLPFIALDDCTVIINAITGDVIRVDFPMVE